MRKLILAVWLVLALAGCGGPRLSNAITSTDGSLTANYPNTWVARAGEGTLYMASSQAVLDNPRSVPSGEFVMAVGVIPDSMVAEISQSTGMMMNTPQVILNVLGTRISGIDLDFTSVLGNVTTLTLADHPAARAGMTFTSEIGPGEGQIIVRDEGNDVYIAIIGDHRREMSRNEATFIAVALCGV
ncbi:MAG: hypothetical protein U0694_04180 [Anaerolineae bacterium]